MAQLPTLGGSPFLIDAGLETCLIFHDGFELLQFASFTLLDDPRGVEGLKAYYRKFLTLADELGAGFVLDAPSWRSSPDWGEALGYDRARLAEANRAGIALIAGLRGEMSGANAIVLNLPVGPRGDGYSPGRMMSTAEACDYHRWQIGLAADAGAELVTALTMTYLEEAQGIAGAARDAGLKAVVSFTVETDGRLPTGMTLAEAVKRTDDSIGDVAYYMINCAHPSHFAAVLDDPELAARIGGLRANASRMSHAELDDAIELDEGDPAELACDYRDMLAALPHLCVLGGCCGTDHRHVEAIARACLPLMRA
ncbi:homocysteine S-methyltransferase family protein [Novosphingobium sp. Chol11]|uniref:homocysteine S-methyltransferase family protein n=1 Tax=Novosphingobium sp. Chol11 TaxID=1385763 RepID=UPI0025F26664|nr:homocysteine S-methyltransferase family protein [Novosphingobium sp. Chol11]